jgi:hypothetical protein
MNSAIWRFAHQPSPDLRFVGCVLAPPGDAAAARPADNQSMIERSPFSAATLTADDLARIQTSCSHARVPDEPAVRGYRYIDVGGDAAPFYLRRLTAGPITGAITLTAPIELSSAEEAERGAPALARAGVTIGVNSVPWSSLVDQKISGGVWQDLIRQALTELSQLDLIDAGECPICAG